MPAPVPDLLHRKEGWFRFCQTRRAAAPPSMTPDEFLALPETEREAVTAAWRRHNSALGPYVLGHVKQIGDQVIELAEANDALPFDRIRRAAAIDGLPTLGKTTLLRLIAARYHRGKIAEHGTETVYGDEYIPVCIVTLPKDSTIKALNSQIIEFYGHTAPAKATASDLTRRAIHVMQTCGTTMVAIDDLHYMNVRALSGKELNDHLKHLMNEIPATFLLAGVGLEHEGIFKEGRADGEARYAQLSHRTRRFGISSIDISDRDGEREWRSLLRAIEQDVRGLAPVRISDKDTARNLHRRTGGSIGALADLMNLAARRALQHDLRDPRRAVGITVPLLDAIQLSHGAEQRDRSERKTANPSRRKAA
jgi:hypothetical protein